jgi:hypothetical protein
MTDSIVRVFSRLSADAAGRLLTRVGLEPGALPDQTWRTRKKLVMDLVARGPDGPRAMVEGVAGRIVSLTDKAELAEVALRAACFDDAQLSAIVDAETTSIEERALELFLEEPRRLDRAANLAAGHRWRGGRQHCNFRVLGGHELSGDITNAIDQIRRTVQETQGGRKVDHDHFTYPDLFSINPDADPSTAPRVHHVAVYVEAPASYWMEFPEGSPAMAPVLRNEAKEIALDYDPSSGALDIAGKGVGGSQTLQKIAEQFGDAALAGVVPVRVQRRDWGLDLFLVTEAPRLAPPPGFASVRVEEIELRSRARRSAIVSYKAGDGHSAYDRMKELGVTDQMLLLELLRSVTLELDTIATPAADSRYVRATVSWPNSTKFDSATPADRRAIEAWLSALSANSAS